MDDRKYVAENIISSLQQYHKTGIKDELFDLLDINLYPSYEKLFKIYGDKICLTINRLQQSAIVNKEISFEKLQNREPFESFYKSYLNCINRYTIRDLTIFKYLQMRFLENKV